MEQQKKFHLIRPGEKLPGDWFPTAIPANIIVGQNSMIDTAAVFKQFFSKLPVGLKIGDHVTIRSANICTEESAMIEIGDYSFISNASLASNVKITIGKYVCIAGGVNIVDTDFHPLTPAERIADTEALSPAGNKMIRPAFSSAEVIIEDGVWIGFNATILKGVRIGKDAVIQPGSVVSKDVEPGSVMEGNPAKMIRKVDE